MNRKTPLYLAMSALVGFAMSASAEEIFLFPAKSITASGFGTNISQTEVYDHKGTTVYCAGEGTAYLRTVGDENNHLIVDNYATLNDADTVSICTGGSSIDGNGNPITSGTHCFKSGNSSGTGAIEDHFDNRDPSTVTAPVNLVDGQNDLLFKLWDYGVVYGNTALELALPENCSSEPPTTTTNLCAAQDTDIGNVNVRNDSENLYVDFEITEPNWYLEETHVAVGSIDDMTNKPGNPVPGRFPYECESLGEQETACTIEIPLGEIEAEGSVVDVAAHAVAYQLRGDGCDDELFFANDVIDNSQGTLVDSDTLVSKSDETRSDPEAVFAANDGAFFSLGFEGSLTVGFGDRIYNGPGADVCAREVTNGRDNYPEEKAGVLIDDITPTPGEITNEGTSDDGGKACVGLPFDVISADSVTLFDTTNPELFDGTIGRERSNADGYDVDWIAACYLADDETAWGGACEAVDDDVVGERFTKRGNWGTYFQYEIK